jgi:hypothetical protein
VPVPYYLSFVAPQKAVDGVAPSQVATHPVDKYNAGFEPGTTGLKSGVLPVNCHVPHQPPHPAQPPHTTVHKLPHPTPLLITVQVLNGINNVNVMACWCKQWEGKNHNTLRSEVNNVTVKSCNGVTCYRLCHESSVITFRSDTSSSCGRVITVGCGNGSHELEAITFRSDNFPLPC